MTVDATRNASLPGASGRANRKPGALLRYFSRFDDGEVARWAFRGMLLGTIGVLCIDLNDLSSAHGWWDKESPATVDIPAEPILPPAVETNSPMPSSDPRRFVTTESATLSQPMQFTLGSGGVLLAEGSIQPGTAARFAAEIDTRGEYVKTIALNSPGGALDDAMAMARLIRDKGISTQIDDGALCASSCPLLFAGGTTRKAGPEAAVGVHQFYAASETETKPAQAMSDAQATTARISRHLTGMGVDPAVWLHALDTPPRALYYLSPKELTDYRLVTGPVLAARKRG